MKHKEELKEVIKTYRDRGITCDQNELIQLLREVQTLFGGVIPQKALEKTAEKLELKMTFIDALLQAVSVDTNGGRTAYTVCLRREKLRQAGGAVGFCGTDLWRTGGRHGGSRLPLQGDGLHEKIPAKAPASNGTAISIQG